MLVDLGRVHLLEHGDSIVPVLVSLQRYTPLYWDQERYGMLVPLLALPFRNPLWNLLVERGLLVLSGLAGVVLLARYAFLGRLGWLLGLVGASALLWLLPAPWLFEFLGDQPYGLSLALGVGGLLVASSFEGGGRKGWLAGLFLSLLSGWVNAGAVLFLLPLVLSRAAADRAEGGEGRLILRRLGKELGLVFAGVLAGQLGIFLYPFLTGFPLRLDLGASRLSVWPVSFLRLLANGLAAAGPRFAWVLCALALVGLALPWASRPCGTREEGPKKRALLRAGLFLSAALFSAFATSTLRWVAENQFHFRYLALPLILAQLAVLSFLAEALMRSARLSGPGIWLALWLLPLSAMVFYGPPSLSRVRRDLDAVLGTYTEDVLAGKCDLVTGDYWSVWPAVWHASWVAYERGQKGPYGLTHRSNPTAPFWKARPLSDLRVCRVRGAEVEAERWLKAFHLWPVRVLETRATVEVVAPFRP